MNNKILIIIIALLLFTTNAYAVQIGNISASVEQGRWKFGIFNDQIQDKEFRVRTGTGPMALLTGAEIDESSTTGLEAAYGLMDNLTLIIKAGFSDRTLKTDWNDGSLTEMEYEQTIFWGGGLRYMIGSPDAVMVVFSGQAATQSGSEVESIKENGVSASSISEPGEGTLTEYQGSVIFGFNLPLSGSMSVLPYLGLVANNSKLKSDTLRYTASGIDYEIAKLELEESQRFGVVLGANLQLGQQFNLNLETRLKTETAFSAGINFSF